MAVFLVPAALTGSLLVWRHEIDVWLNPQLHRVAWRGADPLSEGHLVAALRQQYPQLRVVGIEPPPGADRSAMLAVIHWPRPADDSHWTNEVFVDPTTGIVLGARSSVTPRFNRAEFMHWIHRFHYTLMLKRTGMIFMGGVAMVWLVDCFGGALLTLPRTLARWRKWRIAWQVRGSRLNFDLHRAGGLWLWPVLFVLAASSIYLNLTHEVFVPATEWLVETLLPQHVQHAVLDAILEWQYPLHTGEAFGLAGRMVVFISGLAIAGLAITGVTTTIRKLRRRERTSATSSAADTRTPRGSLRIPGRGRSTAT